MRNTTLRAVQMNAERIILREGVSKINPPPPHAAGQQVQGNVEFVSGRSLAEEEDKAPL